MELSTKEILKYHYKKLELERIKEMIISEKPRKRKDKIIKVFT